MSSTEEHKNTFIELINDINEKIRSRLLVQRQKIIGFASSEASTNLFAYFLHKKELISQGFNVNHKFFASTKKSREIFKQVFDKREELLDLLVQQEYFRDKLCYGKTKEEKEVTRAVTNLFKLKELIENLLGEKL